MAPPRDPVDPVVRDGLARLAAKFQAGKPFRHVVIDGFLRPAIAEAMLAEFRSHPDPSGLKDDFGEPNPRATVADIRSLGGVYAALDEDIRDVPFLRIMAAISAFRICGTTPIISAAAPMSPFQAPGSTRIATSTFTRSPAGAGDSTR